MQVPKRLQAGDVVRLIAPSGCFEPERFLAGVELLRRVGLVPRFDDGLLARRRYLAGDDERRSAELLAALADPEAKAVWAARGGYGATRLLPALPLDAVVRRRPWLVGFSDITALHCRWAQAGTASVHGANVTTLVSWSEPARQELFDLLMRPRPLTYQGTPRPLPEGASARVSGILLGGNLTVLGAMAGTGFLPSWHDAVVLLEDVGERPYRLDRMLTQLRQAGAFAGVRAVLVGQLAGCEEPDATAGYTALEVIGDVLADLGVPIVGGLPVGHESSSRAVLLGGVASVDAGAGLVTVAPCEYDAQP
jgi:muramoyltetrapeptide carboxypeptidase